MPAPVSCEPRCCAEELVVNIPGPTGPTAADGTDGADGLNAFTLTTADFVVPAISANVTIEVADSSWMTVGQNVFVEDAGVFEVVSKPDTNHATLTYLNYVGNTNSGNNVTFPAQVSPAGTEPDISGLGQDATFVEGDSLAYDITNAYALVTGITVVVPTTGLYEIKAGASVDYTGVTFVASRTLSLRVQNTTAAATVTETTRSTGIQTTATFPTQDNVLPVLTDNFTAGDVLELQAKLDTVESAGSSVVNSAWLEILPILLV